MKYLILTVLSLLLLSCKSGENGNNGKQEMGISEYFLTEYNYLFDKGRECNLNYESQMNEKGKIITIKFPTRILTETEKEKFEICRTNIEALTCESEAVINFDLSTVPDCLFYENTEGFPTAKTSCETNMTGFCQAPRSCVDGVSCEVYQGGMPFRKGCAEPSSGEYTCTGDYDNAPFCKPFWVEYTSGCHDEPGYVKENSFDNLCDKFGDVLLIEDDSVVEQFEACFNAIPHQGDYYTCEDLYDINYDISTIPECQFIFAE